MIQRDRYPGEWCDVDYSPTGDSWVFASLEQPGTIVVRKSSSDSRTTLSDISSFALGRWGLYLRAAADGQGNVCCVLQDGRDRNPATGQYYPAICVIFPRDGAPFEVGCPAGPAFGQNAVEVVGFDSDGWLVYVVTGPTTFWEATLGRDGAWKVPTVRTWPQTSQGFADDDDRMDDVRASVPGMVCPSAVDGVVVGQAGEPDRIRGLHHGVYFTVLAGAAFEPHLASDGQGRWMACARTPQGAALVALAAPFEPETEPEPEPKPIPDTPPPDPEPEKEPDVLPTVNQIPRDQIAMAIDAIDIYLINNPRLGLPEGLLSVTDVDMVKPSLALDAVIAYVIGEWCPEVCRLGPFPGDAAGWTQRREAGLHHTFRKIEQERGEQPGPGQPPPTGTLRGPISVSGRDFTTP